MSYEICLLFLLAFFFTFLHCTERRARKNYCRELAIVKCLQYNILLLLFSSPFSLFLLSIFSSAGLSGECLVFVSGGKGASITIDTFLLLGLSEHKRIPYPNRMRMLEIICNFHNNKV